MYLVNPLRPGSVTTDILADGAVTLIKTDFETVQLPVSAGGTGTATPGLIAGTAIQITGNWPNQTINNIGNYASLPVPLPIAQGGTGITSPNYTWDSKGNIVGNAGLPAQTTLKVTDAAGNKVFRMWLDGSDFVEADYIFLNLGGEVSNNAAWQLGGASTNGVQFIVDPSNLFQLQSDNASGVFEQVLTLQTHVNNPTLNIKVPVDLTTPLPVNSGGTGTATPALVEGAGITISGTWPSQTITNSSAYASLPSPLPIANGGTGTATPGLIAGSNIIITGSWPDQTISLDVPLVFGVAGMNVGNVFLLGSSVGGANQTIIGVGAGDVDSNILAIRTGSILSNSNVIAIGGSKQVVMAGSLTIGGDLHVPGTSFIESIEVNSGTFEVDTLGNIVRITNLPTANAGVPILLQALIFESQTNPIAQATLYTSGASRLFRVSGYLYATGGAAGNEFAEAIVITYVLHGTTFTIQVCNVAAVGSPVAADGIFLIRVDAGSIITYETTQTTGAGGSYDMFLNLEQI